MLEYLDEEEDFFPPPKQRRDYVQINVSGMMYETYKTTLERFPSTLLGSEESRMQYFEKSRNAYFFNRNRHCFEAILYYYQSNGLLSRPPNIPMPLFVAEASFFGLGVDVITNVQIKEGYGLQQIEDLPKNLLQGEIWKLFEYPEFSIASKIIAYWSVSVVIASIVVFCLESVPEFRGHHTKGNEHMEPWFSLELVFIIWFTLEYLLRFMSSPSKRDFLTSMLNFIDLLAILPYFLTLFVAVGNVTVLEVLRVVRLIRVFRIFKLSRHSQGLQVLWETLKSSVNEFALILLFVMFGIILFSGTIYYVEEDTNFMFSSIPDAFWFSLVTMTTVGYGDKWPYAPVGKLLATFCALSGMLMIALPLPVIIRNFEFYYRKMKMAPSQQVYPNAFDEDATKETRGSETKNEVS